MFHYFQYKQVSLALAGVFIFQSSQQVNAGRLDRPEDHAIVNAGDPIEAWDLSNGATLTVNPGGATKDLFSRDSFVNLSGATVAGGANQALHLGGSSATVNNSTLTSENYALNVTQNSQARVYNSVITGTGRAVNVSGASHVLLSGTQVIERNAGNNDLVSAGLMLVNGHATVSDGSSIVGEQNGVYVLPDRFNGDAGRHSTLAVDNSHIEGQSGSAIKVSSYTDGRPADFKLTVSNGSTLKGGNGVILEVEREAKVDFNVSNSTLAGDIQVAEGAHTSVTLRDNAMLHGAMTGVEHLNVRDGAVWNLDKNSDAQHLTMNQGRINLGGSSGNFHQLSLQSLAGSGTFGLNTDLHADQGDQLVISGETSGNHMLVIQNSGQDAAKGQAPLKLVQTGDGKAQFATLGGQVDVGTFAYDLEQRGNDWFLVQRQGDVLTPGARSVVALFNASTTVWYGELSSLRNRMGELRMGNGEGGAWSRAYGNKQNVAAGAGVAYQQRQQGISLGVDGALPVSNGQALLGLMGGYSRSNLDLAAGTSGSVDSYYVGAYGTWLAEDGYYVDALTKLNRFQNDSKVRMSDGSRTSGDYANHGLGASLEGGRRIAITDSIDVTPFGQVSALWVQGRDYNLDNGMQARGNAANSLLGKLGSKIGQTHELANGGRFDYYAKAALAHEFANNDQVKVNGNRFRNDLSGSRGEFGVGSALQVSDRVQVHADLDYSNGRNLEQPWGLNLGARYNW